jgi:hypothetical protein
MTPPSARRLWWFIAVASFFAAAGKAATADWIGALSSGCIAFATLLIALGPGRGGELNGGARMLAYVLLGASIAITAGRMLGVSPSVAG